MPLLTIANADAFRQKTDVIHIDNRPGCSYHHNDVAAVYTQPGEGLARLHLLTDGRWILIHLTSSSGIKCRIRFDEITSKEAVEWADSNNVHRQWSAED